MAMIPQHSGSFIRCAMQRPVWAGGIRVSAVVGTILNLVNHGPSLMIGHSPSWAGLILNYVIPFCVSVYSGARIAMREKIARDPGPALPAEFG